jgi:protoporphyrinogen oxidase
MADERIRDHMKIAIIGGGLTGLALAERLREPGRSITVMESAPRVGGLATWHDYGSFCWDRFYHVILPSDRNLIGFIRDIGLGESLRWVRTLTGFFVDRAFHSMSSNVDFLRFPPLNLIGKMRLAFTILYCSRVNDWRRLEQIPVGDFLRKLSGARTYDKIWRPLLLAKLGENYQRVSAVFIWSYIKRMFSARDPSTAKEQLGYVRGGYKAVLERIEQRIRRSGGDVRTGVSVRRISPAPGGGMIVQHGEQSEHFDKVIFTAPVSALRSVAAESLCSVQQPGGPDVEYLGVVCAVLITRTPLVPYYVVNIADERVPFTGIIGMSNLVSGEETGGLHITYLPKYVHSTDPLLSAPEEELRKLFTDGLRIMFPQLQSRHVVAMHINRAVKVQPLQVMGYSQLVPSVTTSHPDFFVLNTSQFASNTLNNNEVIRSVDEFVEQHQGSFAQPIANRFSTPQIAEQVL